MGMSSFRQSLVDAAVEELNHQLGAAYVSAEGAKIQTGEPFNMARVVERVFRRAFVDHSVFIEEVARNIAPAGGDWSDYVDEADCAITGMFGVLMSELDI